MLKQLSLAGRTAFITGSTSGIGLAYANALASYGAKVALNSNLPEQETQKIQDELKRKWKTEVSYFQADMRNPEEIESSINAAQRTFGSLDILVNNAGIQHVSPIEDFPNDKWEEIISINLSSVFYTTKYALPHMQKSGWGRIVNTASAHALVASVHKAAYIAAKHGVVGMTKSIALEQAGNNITCNAICPGYVKTELMEK